MKFQNNVRVLEKDNTMLREALSDAVSKAEEAKQVKIVEVKPQLEYIPIVDCKPLVESIAIQTTETAFALCATCVSMQKCLLSCSTLTSQLCTSLSLNSAVDEKNFPSTMEETGRIDHNLWLALSQQDTKSVLRAVSRLQEQCANLKSDLSNREQNVKSLDFKLNEVKKEFGECMSNYEASEAQHKDDMANLCSEYEAKFEQLQQQNSRLLKDVDTTEALVNEYRIKEAHFKKEIDTASKIYAIEKYWLPDCPLCTVVLSLFSICDRACKNRPSEYKKLPIFVVCFLITIYTTTTKSLSLVQNLMGFLLQLTEIEYCILNRRY